MLFIGLYFTLLYWFFTQPFIPIFFQNVDSGTSPFIPSGGTMTFDVPEIPVESIGFEEVPEVESSPDLPPMDIDGKLYCKLLLLKKTKSLQCNSGGVIHLFFFKHQVISAQPQLCLINF